MHTDAETNYAAKAARVRHTGREDESSLLDLNVVKTGRCRQEA